MPKHEAMTFGRYQLVERIAAGGMGEVFIALQTGIGQFSRPIAVKLLLPHLVDDPKSVSMFLTEARVGAQMTHANIAQVYDVGHERDRYFIAMELVRGVSLSKLIAGLKAHGEHLSPELVAYVGRCLCEGLHVAHEATGADGQALQLVHRDVTPHNVLLSVDGAVKLTDFGIARVADADRLSRPGVVLGKLGYLAPEQITGAALDRRVDLFAAGATLFHLAALEKPFDTPTGATIDPQRLPTVPLRVCRPDLPRPLIDAIERAMDPNVEHRWPTAKDFRNALPIPGPDAAEALGTLLRRVCGAALVELEHKTERATQAIRMAEAPLPSEIETRPRVVRSATHADTQASVVPRDWRPFTALGVLVVVIAGALAWAATSTRENASLPANPPPMIATPTPTPVVEEPVVASPVATPVTSAPTTTESTPGWLSIDATPWANVTLDGKSLGETPLAHIKVSAGQHLLIATNPESGRSVRKSVTVTSGRTATVRLDLR